MNSVRGVASTAFSYAAPYLQNSEWMEKTFNAILERTESLELLEEVLKEEINKQNDVTKKADLKIYLTYLEKEWRKCVD